MIITKTYKSYYSIKKFLPLFHELYPHKSVRTLAIELKLLIKSKNYRLLVSFYNNKPIAIASLTEGFLIYCGKYMQISNLYVNKSYRNLGVAKSLISVAENYAKKSHCNLLSLDSYVTNKASHKTYFREGFNIKAYHFTKEL